jgi:hypothetical protein
LNKIFYSLIIAGIILFAGACNETKNTEQAATAQLAEIASLIQRNELNQAKQRIDSFHVQFRKLVLQRKQAVALNDTIILRESARTLAYCNANLARMKSELNEMQRKFDFVKNEKYEDFGKYVLKSQRNLLLSGKTTLLCEVGEKGELELTSLYSGSNINHKSIVLNAQSGNVITEESQAVLHAFKDEGLSVEQLTFDLLSSDSIVKFISENENFAIKVQLQGNKQVSYSLDKNQINAIKTSYTFARALKKVQDTENAQRIAMQRIGKINLLYQQ